jgi:hypothetical protein
MNISKKLNSLINEENKTILIGLLTILIGIWLVMYLIPSFFVSLFNTILGNLILFIIVILVGVQDYKYGLGLGLIFIILIRFADLISVSKKEAFELSEKSTNDFLLIQNTINPKIVFDIEEIKKQANQEEMDYFLENGMWPWSEEVIQLYREAVERNQLIRTYSGDSVNYARKIYNQAAILRILSLETKEGKFLISGVQVNDGVANKLEDLPSGFGDFGYESGLIKHMKPVIKCKIDDNGNGSLEKTVYTGKDGIYGAQTSIESEVDYNNLESEIPGFKFVNGPCDPCKSINGSPEYSCPFRLDVEKVEPGISSVWQYLWGLK